VLVGTCAVALRSGVATRPVRDVDVYCPKRDRPISILSAEGFCQIGPNKFLFKNVIVDIIHPYLPRINRINRSLLDHCLARQTPVAAAMSGPTTAAVTCPTTLALLLLKLYSASRRTMWLTRLHDLHDAATLVAYRPKSGRMRPNVH
jgi:hypothetical protein